MRTFADRWRVLVTFSRWNAGFAISNRFYAPTSLKLPKKLNTPWAILCHTYTSTIYLLFVHKENDRQRERQNIESSRHTLILVHGSQAVHWDQAPILQLICAGALASRVFREDLCLGETNTDQVNDNFTVVKTVGLTHLTNFMIWECGYIHVILYTHSISLIKSAYQYKQSRNSPHGETL